MPNLPNSRHNPIVVSDSGTVTFENTSYGTPIRSPNSYTVHKRSIAQRQADLVRITELYLLGSTHDQIAEILSSERDYSISRSQITLDVQAVLQAWHERYVGDINAATASTIIKLDKLETTYWDAWERSQRQSIEIEDSIQNLGNDFPNEQDEEAVPDGELFENDENTVPTKSEKRGRGRPKVLRAVSKRTVERDGNYQFLMGIERVVAMRMKILGIGQSTTVNVNWKKQAEEAGLNPDDVIDVIVQQIVEAKNKDEVPETTPLLGDSGEKIVDLDKPIA
jgi:hypothetical protein